MPKGWTWLLLVSTNAPDAAGPGQTQHAFAFSNRMRTDENTKTVHYKIFWPLDPEIFETKIFGTWYRYIHLNNTYPDLEWIFFFIKINLKTGVSVSQKYKHDKKWICEIMRFFQIMTRLLWISYLRPHINRTPRLVQKLLSFGFH